MTLAEPKTLWELLRFDAELPTWFGVGGSADRYIEPPDLPTLRDALMAFAGHRIRVLGDGANLLVCDQGVDGLVVNLKALDKVETIADSTQPGADVIVRAQAGAQLPKLIVDTVRDGLAGLEVLAGIPASVGGAAIMNAGGAFGEIGDHIHAVHALTHSAAELCIPANQIAFDYRSSGLEHLVITAVDFRLTRLAKADQPALRQRLKDIMAYKKDTQPMGADSAGCAFKNPTVKGERLSAGMLIDQAGCKGWREGGAEVSTVHANFIVTHDGCTATDILNLMDRVAARVRAEHHIELKPEIAIWRREPE